jgi:hypothetical protein
LPAATRAQGRTVAKIAMHALAAAACLVLPEADTKTDLTSWEAAIVDIGGKPKEEQQAFITTFLPLAKDHPDAAVRHAIEGAVAASDGTRLRMAMLGAAMAGSVTVFVKRHHEHAYKTHPDLWRRGIPYVANPAIMALFGRFIIASGLLAHANLALELSGADLFLDTKQFQRLVRRDRVSPAVLERSARLIVKKSQEEDPERIMLNREIEEEVRRSNPRAGGRALQRAIKSAKPPEWSKAGRRRGR